MTESLKPQSHLMKKLSSLLGGYDCAQTRIDKDYVDVLFLPMSALPVALLGSLVSLAGNICNVIAAWEYELGDKKPSYLWTALARKAFYAVGYIVRRFQEDVQLCSRFHAYRPHLDVIEGHLRMINAKLGASAGDEEAQRLDNELEIAFAKLMLTQGHIMDGLLERVVVLVKKENPRKAIAIMKSSRSYTDKSHNSLTSSNNGPDSAKEDYHRHNTHHSHASYQSEANRPTGNSAATSMLRSYSTPSKMTQPKESTSRQIVTVKTVKYPKSKLDSTYDPDADDDDIYEQLPSTSALASRPRKSTHTDLDMARRPSSSMTMPAPSHSNHASLSNVPRTRTNSNGYVKDSEPSTALIRRVEMPSCVEEPEEMASGAYNFTAPSNSQHSHSNTFRHYGRLPYDPGQYGPHPRPHPHPHPHPTPNPHPIHNSHPHPHSHPHPYPHHHQSHQTYYPAPAPHPTPAYYPYAPYPAPHPGWNYPPQATPAAYQSSSSGVHIIDSFNQRGNVVNQTIETITTTRDKKKSRAGASKSKKWDHYE